MAALQQDEKGNGCVCPESTVQWEGDGQSSIIASESVTTFEDLSAPTAPQQWLISQTDNHGSLEDPCAAGIAWRIMPSGHPFKGMFDTLCNGCDKEDMKWSAK